MITACAHYEGGRRIWCPPMCPVQCEPRPVTARARRRWRREHRSDTPSSHADEVEEVVLTLDTSTFRAEMKKAQAAVERHTRYYERLRARIISALFGRPPPSDN